jgi:nucleotide-binding universal stress UspA family protein
MKIRRILYASDCTKEAAHGAAAAVALAASFSAELNILNVIRSNDIDDPGEFSHIQKQYYEAVEAILPQSVHQLCEWKTFVSVGQPHIEILKHIVERKVDLLILGLKRSRHFGSQSGTSRVFPIIVEASCPVLTVASDSDFQAF